MRSRVKRSPRAIEPLTTNRKEVQINLNEEEQEDPIPLDQRCGGLAGTKTSLGLER